MKNLDLFARNTMARLSKIKTDQPQSGLAQVTGWNTEKGAFEGRLPDGSLRLFRYLGSAALPVGSQIATVLPDRSVIGWGDTKAK